MAVSGWLKRGLVLLLCAPSMLQAALWQDHPPAQPEVAAQSAAPVYYRALKLNRDGMQVLLDQSLPETGILQTGGEPLELPLPKGGFVRVYVEASPVMAPELAARYPAIRTYRVRGVDQAAISGRVDLTPLGFHALLNTPAGSVFIDPDSSGGYRSFYKQDYARANPEAGQAHVCQHVEHAPGGVKEWNSSSLQPAARTLSGSQRRIYRLAVAATGEYTAYFGGRTDLALAQIVTAINRVNQIYGRDLAVQFQLVGNNDRIIYSDADSDPYTHRADTIPTMLEENQQTLDYILGSHQYDIGHLFGLVGGGLATLGSACMDYKAQAYTGTPHPDSDVFYIDFVAHELGHQLNANHSFNGTTSNCGGINRNPATAMEPGSGSTIMSYAGICGEEDLQAHSDATFHAVSIQEMHEFITIGNGHRCGALVSTGNTAPVVDAGAMGDDGTYSLPIGTPFRLTGQAQDAEGDTLSYQWDEMDAGGASGATDAQTIGTDIPGQPNPLFRSFLPKSSPERYVPRLSTLLSGQFGIGETLPETERELNFRLTVRDGASGVGDDDLRIQVDPSLGVFAVIGGSLNNGGSFSAGSTQSIRWSVSGTDRDCGQLKISLLSLNDPDAPTRYCDMGDEGLAVLDLGDFPNIGMATVTLPDTAMQNGRVMLACTSGLFFNLSHENIRILGEGEIGSDCKPIDGEDREHGTVFTDADSAAKFDSPGGGGALWFLNLLLVAFSLGSRRSARSKG
ncbi:MAG: reprolysin-like metallopeptidase [Candidatus Thiodiazotropha sp.]